MLTTDAVGPLAQVHDRMPLVLPPSALGRLARPGRRAPDDEAVAALLAPPSPELVAALELRPVVAAVNNVRNNGPELLDALAAEEVAEPLQLDLLAGPNPQ